jgi:aerobic-type carbon monoxide dehydrogenase small subunit (CoxS/CutS family)
VNGEQLLSLDVNGRRRSVRATPSTTLLTILRDELMLTGAKRGCNQGVCGACTVLVDDLPVRSCLSLAMNLIGRMITTIEGLAQGQELAPVQRALLDGGAVQCGFCTSGVVVSAFALLRQNPHPSPDEVRAALSGNLCRCSGYIKIVEAICHAGKEARS